MRIRFFIALFPVFIQFMCIAGTQEDNVIIETKYGKVEGDVVKVNADFSAAVFKGIPYGIANRFEKPEPVKAWDGTKETKNWGPVCPQLSSYLLVDTTTDTKNYSEDCLSLNVFTVYPTKGNRFIIPIIFVMEKSKRSQSRPFTVQEKAFIRSFVRENTAVLQCTDGKSDSNKHKIAKWKELASQLSAMHGNSRDWEKVRKCWINMCQTAKGEAAAEKKAKRKTGGGRATPPPMTEGSEEVLGILGANNPSILGHAKGLDVADDDYQLHDRGEDEDMDGGNDSSESANIEQSSIPEGMDTAPQLPLPSNRSHSSRPTAPIKEKLPTKEEMVIRVLLAEEGKHLAEKAKFEAEQEYIRKKELAIDRFVAAADSIAISIGNFCSGRSQHQTENWVREGDSDEGDRLYHNL